MSARDKAKDAVLGLGGAVAKAGAGWVFERLGDAIVRWRPNGLVARRRERIRAAAHKAMIEAVDRGIERLGREGK